MAARYLKNRIAIFTALPMERLDHIALRKELRDIGQMEGEGPAAKAGQSTGD